MQPRIRIDRSLGVGALPGAALIALGALTLAAYVPFLGTGFAATDSLTLVESSRLSNVGDVGRLFTTPVMGGTSFVLTEVVYRPFVSLMFGLEFLIWGLDSVGYHLTNLLLHLAAVVAVCLLLRTLGLRWWSSVAGAGLFALHPIVVATVPVIARRDSVVPVVAFATAAWLLLIAQDAHGVRRSATLVLSLLLAAVALLSKESTFVAIGLLPLLLVARGLKRGLPVRDVLWAARWAVPFVLLAAAIFFVRLQVLRQLGGSGTADPQFVDLYGYGVTAGAYLRDLVWPFAALAPSTREIWFRLSLVFLGGLALTVAWLPRGTAALAGTGLLWIVAFGVFSAVLKVATIGWLAYFSLLGVALLVAAGAEGAVERLARRQLGAVWREAVARASAGVLLLALTLFGVSSVAASALFRDYRQWQVAGQVTLRYTDALGACVASAPDVSYVSLARVPAELDDGRFDTSLLGVSLIQQYTAESALRLRFPERKLDVHVSSWDTLRGSAESIAFSCARLPKGVELSAHY